MVGGPGSGVEVLIVWSGPFRIWPSLQTTSKSETSLVFWVSRTDQWQQSIQSDFLERPRNGRDREHRQASIYSGGGRLNEDTALKINEKENKWKVRISNENQSTTGEKDLVS